MKDVNTLPEISVVTIVFNNIKFIEKTILSVINQTYPNIQYVIIDGGSTDGTVDVIKKYASQLNYWVSEKDKGIYDAMNKGLRASTGNYVLFLNSGDLFADESVLSKMLSVAGGDVYYGETLLIDEDQKVLGTRTELTTRKLPRNLTWKSMKNGMVVSHQSILVKRSLAGEYNLDYKCSADIDWVIRCLKNAGKIINSGIVVSKYLVGGFSIANQRRCWRERFQVYRDHYGLITTLGVHVVIIGKNLLYKLSGKKNY